MKNNSNIQQAILNIAQSRGVQLQPREDFEIITQPDTSSFLIIWKNKKTTQPTNAELEAEENLIIASQNKTAYIAERKKKYPSIEDQLDMLWHGYENVTQSGSDLSGMFSQWFNALKKVKQQYPKP